METRTDAPSATDTSAQRCTALRKDGQPCTRRAVPDSTLCVFHDPRAVVWRSAGGKATRRSARSMRLLPERLRPVFDRLLTVFERLDADNYDRQKAVAMAQVATVLARIFQAGELEERMRELERRAEAHEQDGPSPWG